MAPHNHLVEIDAERHVGDLDLAVRHAAFLVQVRPGPLLPPHRLRGGGAGGAVLEPIRRRVGGTALRPVGVTHAAGVQVLLLIDELAELVDGVDVRPGRHERLPWEGGVVRQRPRGQVRVLLAPGRVQLAGALRVVRRLPVSRRTGLGTGWRGWFVAWFRFSSKGEKKKIKTHKIRKSEVASRQRERERERERERGKRSRPIQSQDVPGDGLPGDGLPGDGLPGDGLPGLPGDGLPGLPGDGLPGDGLPGFGLPGLPGDGFPGDGLPGLPGFGDGLPGFGDGLPGFGDGLPGFGDGLPGFGDGLPGFGDGLPGFGDGLPGFGDGLPGFGDGLPGFGDGLPGFGDGLPGFGFGLGLGLGFGAAHTRGSRRGRMCENEREGE